MPVHALIVEDEESILLSLEFLLTEEGYSVVTAQDGAAALNAAAAQTPDLVLLDVMLPHIDGFEVCRQMRANPLLKNTRIMMVTARPIAPYSPADRSAGSALRARSVRGGTAAMHAR